MRDLVVLSLLACINADPSFVLTVSKTVAPEPVNGRVRLYVAASCDTDPRFGASDMADTVQVFGVDAVSLLSNTSVSITTTTLGYPLWSLKELPKGKYCIQADLVKYDVYTRSDGEVLTLPVSCVSDSGQNGKYDLPPGTLFSLPQTISFDPASSSPISLQLDQIIPKTPSPGCSGYGADTDYIKTVNVVSPTLSKFWGKQITLQACVLLPYGFNDHPNALYPLVIAHGHYSPIFEPGGRIDKNPPGDNVTGYARVDQLYANYLYNNWTQATPGGIFENARMLVVTLNHPVPFFDDSYAVDSVNVGPYGSAIMNELLPAIEKQYRGLGAGWARGVMGGSTGGWESLAVQVKYPKEFNAAYVACPDPISFTAYETVNIYNNTNAYWYDSLFKRTPRPGIRDQYSGTDVLPGTSIPTYGHPYGDTSATIEEMNRLELVQGNHSRSCGQWDIWEAVFGPKGKDGYPARIWCKDPQSKECEYGVIDKNVAAYWRDNFDLLHILQRDWSTLGPLVTDKIHLFVGNDDSYFLTNAVMDFQDWASTVTNPPFRGSIVIGTHDGRGFEHCFNGYLEDGTAVPNSVSRELYVSKFIPLMAQRFAASAPPDANMEWHQY